MGILGNLIGAAAGRAIGRQTAGRSGGTLGTIAGMALPIVMRRFGPLGMIGAAIGGYAVNRYMKRRDVPLSSETGTPS